MESSAGRSAMAARSRAAEYEQNKQEEYKKFWQLANEKARQLDFIPEKLSKDGFKYSGNYEYTHFSPDLFPNYKEVFPDNNSTIMKLTIYDSQFDKENKNPYAAHTEEKNLMQAAFKRRISHYFYEDIKDFNQDGVLDLFIDYLRSSKDWDFDKMAKNPALSDEHIRAIVEKLHSEDSNFLQISLLMAHPHAFTTEQTEEIIKNKWFRATCERDNEYAINIYWPSHMGMAKPDVEFRQKLDAISKEKLGKSIYDLNFDGETYFDRLWYKKQYDELIAQHYDKFLPKFKSKDSYDTLVDALALDKNNLLSDNDWNKYLLPVIDSMITPENETDLLNYYGNAQKKLSYLQNRALQGKILSRNTLKNMIDKDHESVDFLFAHKDELNKDILKATYEDAWLYAKGSKSGSELKKEYQKFFGEDIENVKETWDKKYPIGSSRFDILCQKKDMEKIASEYPDNFFKLPEEKIKKLIQEIYISCDENFNVKPEYQDVLNLANKYIDKFGPEVLIENLSRFTCQDIFSFRYLQGIRQPKEIEYLRKYQRRNNVLEAEFNKSGDTLIPAVDVPELLKDKNFEKVDLILKHGYNFYSEEEKYLCLQDFVRLSRSDSGKDPKVQKYVDDFVKNANIDWKKAETASFFSIKDTLDFMLEKYGKNPAVSKKDVEYMFDKARRGNSVWDNVSENAMEKLHKLGYNKPYLAYKLIKYDEHRRNININLNNLDLSEYDFEAKFLQDMPRHPSSDSHTTFLNETLQYWEKEAAVTALNNGASPFTKAGFFRDKFEAMPFNMMFSKALKENKTTELKEFMGYIAANLDENKKGVLKDIWTSLGQKLRDDTRVQSIIRDSDKILKSRDFAQEKIDKELKRKAEEKRRREEERARIEQEKRQAEEKRREEERRIAEEKRREEKRLAEEKRKHEEAVATLRQNILASLTDIISMDNKAITENIAHYLEKNKSELPVIPNADELSAIRIAAFDKKTEELKLKKARDEEKQAQMAETIRTAIEEKEKESASPLSPQEVSEFVTKYFEKDLDAKPFVNSTIKKFSEEAKEKAEIQKKLTKVDEIAADKLIEFYENEPTHGFDYFQSVGKERRNRGYTELTLDVMDELELQSPSGDILNAPQKEQDLFNQVKDKIITLIDKTNEQNYYDEKQDTWVDNRYDFLADIAGYAPAEPAIDEKELLKQAKKDVKKNKKGESIVNSLAGLAALKEKFGKDGK